MKTMIVATTHKQICGESFTLKELTQLKNSLPNDVGIPIFLDFERTKCIGEATNPQVKDKKLYMDIIIDAGYTGYTVPGYLIWANNSLELTSVGLTENPEDTTVGCWHDKNT